MGRGRGGGEALVGPVLRGQDRGGIRARGAAAGGAVRSANGRLPQAPASLLVQLPPDELRRMAESRGMLPPASNNIEDLAQMTPSDIDVLARSVVARRRRDQEVFAWQKRLIDGDDGREGTVDRTTLKRALCHLSCTSWLQILQERHLAHRCAYPTCPNASKRPPLSAASTSLLPMDAPRYRISLAKRTISRDDRDDAGGENGYCGKSCWRRGEWVTRWVLTDAGGEARGQEAAAPLSSSSSSSSSMGGVQSLNPKMGQWTSSRADAAPILDGAAGGGGRWEEMIRQSNGAGREPVPDEEAAWKSIDLMEDMEDRGEVDRLQDDMVLDRKPARAADAVSTPSETTSSPTTLAAAKPKAQEKGIHRSKVMAKSSPPGQRVAAAKRGSPAGPTQNQLAALLDSLTIYERPPGGLATVPASTAETGGEKSGGKDEKQKQLAQVASHGNVEDDEDDGEEAEEEPLSEEELARRAEIDMMFEQGLQAMEQEKQRGTWQD